MVSEVMGESIGCCKNGVQYRVGKEGMKKWLVLINEGSNNGCPYLDGLGYC